MQTDWKLEFYGLGGSAIVGEATYELVSFKEIMLIMDHVAYTELDTRHAIGEASISRSNSPHEISQIPAMTCGAHTRDSAVSA